MLWKLLTDQNAWESNDRDQTDDDDDDIQGNDKFKEVNLRSLLHISQLSCIMLMGQT